MCEFEFGWLDVDLLCEFAVNRRSYRYIGEIVEGNLDICIYAQMLKCSNVCPRHTEFTFQVPNVWQYIAFCHAAGCNDAYMLHTSVALCSISSHPSQIYLYLCIHLLPVMHAKYNLFVCMCVCVCVLNFSFPQATSMQMLSLHTITCRCRKFRIEYTSHQDFNIISAYSHFINFLFSFANLNNDECAHQNFGVI